MTGLYLIYLIAIRLECLKVFLIIAIEDIKQLLEHYFIILLQAVLYRSCYNLVKTCSKFITGVTQVDILFFSNFFIGVFFAHNILILVFPLVEPFLGL